MYMTGGAKIGQWGAFLQRTSSSCRNATTTKQMYPRILSWNIVIVCSSDWFHKYAVMLPDLLRNLTFNRSAHGTQVSDQCPLGLLFHSDHNFTNIAIGIANSVICNFGFDVKSVSTKIVVLLSGSSIIRSSYSAEVSFEISIQIASEHNTNETLGFL